VAADDYIQHILQERKTTVSKLYDLLNAFVEKLALWRMHITNDIFIMFDGLTSLNIWSKWFDKFLHWMSQIICAA